MSWGSLASRRPVDVFKGIKFKTVLGALAGAQRSLVGIEVLDNKGETRDNNQMDLKIMSFILDEK